MEPEVEIVVVKTPSGYLVRPACPRAKPGDTVAWYNYTGDKIQVMLPRKTLMVGAFSEKEGGGGEARLVIREDTARGFYPYAVFSDAAGDFCVGESSPGMIIGR